MRFSVCSCEIRIEFSFILVLCFAIMFGVNELACVLLFSALHELGHLLALALCRGKADSLTLSFYGLALKYSCQLSRFMELFVLIAGPAVNLILYLVLKDDINLALFLLNILPIYPLDGGRVLRLFSYRISVIVSRIFLAVIAVLSVCLIAQFKSFSLFLIAAYLIIYTVMY